MPATRRRNGYSLSELLTVVAITGMIALVGLPAFMQLMPQYWMRTASSEIAGTLRMARQNAMATRRPWRVTFDVTNNRYSLSALSTLPTTTPSNWQKYGSNNRPLPTPSSPWWRNLRNARVNTSGFNDVDSNLGADVIFRRDGTLDPACFTDSPYIRLHMDNNLVKYNTYYIRLESSGNVRTDQTKE